MLIKIVALMVPVGLDAFGVSAALAVAAPHSRRLTRTWLLLTAFETGMPVLGIAIAGPLRIIGGWVNYGAAAVLLIFAVRMLRGSDDDAALAELLDHGIFTAAVLAVSVGLDELAIGLELGVLRAPAAPIIAVITIQAFTVSLLGLRLGQRVGERTREGAERLAGGILGLVAVGLLTEAVVGR